MGEALAAHPARRSRMPPPNPRKARPAAKRRKIPIAAAFHGDAHYINVESYNFIKSYGFAMLSSGVELDLNLACTRWGPASERFAEKPKQRALTSLEPRGAGWPSAKRWAREGRRWTRRAGNGV